LVFAPKEAQFEKSSDLKHRKGKWGRINKNAAGKKYENLNVSWKVL